MARRRRLRWTLLTMGLGAAAQYFLDPDRGAARRNQAREQVQTAAQRAQQRVQGGAEAAQDLTADMAYQTTPPPPPSALQDDTVLTEKVRGEILARPEFSSYGVNIDAVAGIVTLRGQVDDPLAVTELEQVVRKVAGVRDVENFLTTTGVSSNPIAMPPPPPPSL